LLSYQRHIGSLWNAGLLLGFVSRDDVNNALHGRDPGTFLVRFSERHAGQVRLDMRMMFCLMMMLFDVI
jgi:hypothetical protein